MRKACGIKYLDEYSLCNPCTGRDERRRLVKLMFYREALLYDVGNYSYVEGDIIGDTPNVYHKQHQTQDVLDAGNVDAATRALDLSFSRCVEALYPYTKKEIGEEGMEADDKLEEEEVYEMDLSVPATMAENTVKYLSKLIHEFMVCECVYEWLSITYPEKRSVWREKADALRGEIKKALINRTRPTRIKLHPI